MGLDVLIQRQTAEALTLIKKTPCTVLEEVFLAVAACKDVALLTRYFICLQTCAVMLLRRICALKYCVQQKC